MTSKRQQLIEKAQEIMKGSFDPIHDLGHVTRVAHYMNMLTRDAGLTEHEESALELAAWWHDAARTITKNPSMIWMPFFDDMISAMMLFFTVIRGGYFGASAGLAIRVIFCKSLGTGAVLTRILFSRKRRLLVNMLKDADTLDVLNQERTRHLMLLAESSWVYRNGYKVMCAWFFRTSQLHMKTEQARTYLEKILKSFIDWVKEKEIWLWHVEQYGAKWCRRMIRSAEKLLESIIALNATATTA